MQGFHNFHKRMEILETIEYQVNRWIQAWEVCTQGMPVIDLPSIADVQATANDQLRRTDHTMKGPVRRSLPTPASGGLTNLDPDEGEEVDGESQSSEESGGTDSSGESDSSSDDTPVEVAPLGKVPSLPPASCLTQMSRV